MVGIGRMVEERRVIDECNNVKLINENELRDS